MEKVATLPTTTTSVHRTLSEKDWADFNQFRDYCFYYGLNPKAIAEERAVEERMFCGPNRKETFSLVRATRDDQQVGGLLVMRRVIPNPRGGSEIVIGGIADVCTHPDVRGQGVAKKMLPEALEEMFAAGADVGFLFTRYKTEELAALYKNTMGFERIPRHSYFDRSGKLRTEDTGMIAPVCSPGIYAKMMREGFIHLGIGKW